MPATIKYCSQTSQISAALIRVDTCDTRRFMNSLTGIWNEPANVPDYCHASPKGENNDGSRPTANYSLLTANSLTFTFSAKERDPETGCSYFGSRYYSSDLSVWLSVDPMSAKYPHQSNYIYCSNNPIKVVDPNGEDEWEVNKSGHIRYVEGSKGKPDKLFVVKGFGKDNFKKRTEVEGLDVDAELMDGLLNSEDGGKIVFSQTGRSDEMEKMFNYLADNTNVEWALATVDHYDGTGLTPERKDFLITNHSRRTCKESAKLSANYSSYGGLIRLKHSHPAYYSLMHLLDDSSISKPSGNPQGTRDDDGDYGHKRRCTKPGNSPNAIFILRHRGHERTY